MYTILKPFLIGIAILFCPSFYSLAQAATYYVSPTGNNANPGTISQPFATLQKAHDVAKPGDTIYMRGGTYNVTAQITITKSGNSGNPIQVLNYPGEIPILDGSSYNPGSQGYAIIRGDSISWWYFKGLEIAYSPGSGIRFAGSSHDIIIEFCNIHHNVRLDGNGGNIEFDNNQSNISILNNDLHHASINQPSGTGGDGISFNDSQQSGNVIRGNRVWRNHDDGIDLWNAARVLVEGNWIWQNGYDDNLVKTSGNGVGIKLGGTGAGDGYHTVRLNVIWHNGEDGINDNLADNPCNIYNNTSWDHSISGRYNFNFSHGVAHVLKNNVSFGGNGVSLDGSVMQDHNSWNGAVPLTRPTSSRPISPLILAHAKPTVRCPTAIFYNSLPAAI